MKKIFILILTLLWARELIMVFPDLMAVKSRDVKVFDIACVEQDDGLFYPSIQYEDGEELLLKEGFKNPSRCKERYFPLRGETLPLYKRALFGGDTLDPSISYLTYVHLFLLIIATLYIYIKIP